MLSKQEVGQAGEDAAAAWYTAHGYRILARNWRRREGEIDIVAANEECVVFCEVKTRTSNAFGLPIEAVTPQKARRIRMLAALYFAEDAESAQGGSGGVGAGAEGGRRSGSGRGGRSVRFDVAAVMNGAVVITENAF